MEPAMPPPVNKRTPPERSNYLRTRAAADYLGLAESTLAKQRMLGTGPNFIKAGPRVVLYDQADLDAWLDSRKRASTSEGV